MSQEAVASKPSEIIQWPTVRRRVDSLVAYERNPRRLAPADYERLKQSIIDNGYVSKVIATSDGKIIGGHVRIHALKSLGVEEIDVVQAPGPITDEQYKRLLLIDNLHAGEFDIGMLKTDFTLPALQDIGMPELVLGEWAEKKQAGSKAITDNGKPVCLVEFDDEAAQEEFFNEMTARGLVCKLMS